MPISKEIGVDDSTEIRAKLVFGSSIDPVGVEVNGKADSPMSSLFVIEDGDVMALIMTSSIEVYLFLTQEGRILLVRKGTR